MNYFAKNIAALRKLKNQTQQDMAFAMEITKARIGSYEEGRCEPNCNMLIRIADYFKVSIDDLIKKPIN